MPLMNFRLARPEMVVDINRVAELAYVRPVRRRASPSAPSRDSTRWSARRSSGRALPMLAEACRLIGHLPIRHRGTVGGNLAHADPASELPAVMVALEAEMTVAPAWRPADHRRPSSSSPGCSRPPSGPDELLAEIRVPGLPPRTGGAFVEIARRAGDFALVGVAALVTLDDAGRCSARPARALRRRPHAHPRARRRATRSWASDRTGARSTRPPTGRGGDRSRRRHPRVGGVPEEAGASRRTRRPSSWPPAAPEVRHEASRSARSASPSTASRHELAVEPRRLLVDCLRDDSGAHRHPHRVRARRVRHLHGHGQRRDRAVVPDAGRAGRRRRRSRPSKGSRRTGRCIRCRQAFREAQGLQCGFCTPGMLHDRLRAAARHPAPTEAEIREAISANLCRCTGYQGIVEAVQLAAERHAVPRSRRRAEEDTMATTPRTWIGKDVPRLEDPRCSPAARPTSTT